MKRTLLLLIFALSLGYLGWGQSTANYTFTTNTTGSLVLDKNSNAIDMTSGTTGLVLTTSSDQGVSVVTNIGFNFLLMGNIYTQFSVSANGIVQLGSTQVGSSTYVASGGTVASPRISAFAADLGTGTSGSIKSKVVGTAPNQCLVIEFKNMCLLWTSSYTNDGTFQTRLYEDGTLEFVYGAMSITSTASASDKTVGIGFSTNTTANNFAYITSSTNTSTTSGTFTDNPIYSTGAITNLNSSADGSRRVYSYTPPAAPTAPTGINFTSVGLSSMRINWTDNATTETGYLVYRSTDGVNYTFLATQAANSTFYDATGLSPSTTYYWQIYAVNEGTVSSALSGSQATSDPVPVSGIKYIGSGSNPQDYATLTEAFTAINLNGLSGAITLVLNTTYTSTSETFPIAVSTLATGANTITVYPSVTGLSITSANTTGTINFNGSKYVIFDGRVGGTGTTKDLIIANTNAGTSYAVQFINDANNNQIKYCKVNSRNTSTSSGTIVFSTTTGANGNDNNTIDNCDIYDGTSTPYNAIYASGTTTSTAHNNSGVTISNCNIYNFYVNGNTSSGILLSSGNTGWTISGNSFYQTTVRTATTASIQYSIYITNTSGNNFDISNNYIGGDTPNAVVTSNKWTLGGAVGNAFIGIYLSVGTTTTSNIQGNAIRNISLQSSTSNGSIFLAIQIANGNVNIGNITANTIGSGSVSATSASFASIALLQSTSNGGIGDGILNTGSGVINISQNTIGGVYLAAASGVNTLGGTFYGIRSTAGTNTIASNTIGSTTNQNSIFSEGSKNTTTNANMLNGISISSSGVNSITGNLIKNLSYAASGGTGPSTGVRVLGIVASSGTNSITTNVISDLTNVSGNTGTTSSASVIGISMTSTTAGTTLSQNTIYNLSNSHASAAVSVIGIYYAGATTGTNLIARNMMYNLGIVSTSATADLRGINFNSGLANVQNNMIRLGYDASGNSLTTGIQIIGLLDATSTANTGMYFNSVYIGGTGVGTQAGETYAFRSNQTTNTRTYQNNIFVNARSNASTGGKHYAVRVAGTGANPTGLSLNYNDYLASGTGAVFGYYGADVANFAAWKTAVGSNNDGNSINSDPLFSAPTAATPNLKLTTGTPCEGVGLATAGITDDFEGDVRANLTPTDIGADAGDYAAAGIDMSPAALVSPAASGCYTSTESVTVTIKNWSINPIDFTVNPVTVSVTETTGGTSYNSSKIVNAGTLASGATQNVTLDATINMSVNGTYTFNASTSVTGDINTGNDNLAPVTRTVANLGGTKTVGSGGDYTTLTAAVAAYNNATCLTGAVVFSLTDASYTGETFPITINSNTQASATNTLTIKPATGVTASISGSSASGLIVLNGADYVTINGSNGSTANTVCPASAASRNLTLTNTNAGTSSAVVWLQTATANGATNNTIKNCNLTGSGVTQTLFGVGSGSSTISTSSLGTDNDNNSFINNNISGVQYGIYSQGASTGNKNAGTIINQNLVNTSANTKGGILTGFEDNITISGNKISNIASSGSPDVFGIATGMTAISSTTSTGNEVTNATISNNIIGTVVNSGTFSAAGITLASATSGTNTISNNMISGVMSNGTSGDFSAGIVLGGGTGSTTNVYHNTVSMQGTITGSTAASQTSACLAVTNSTAPTLNIKNNIFSNIQAGNTSATLRFAAIALGYSTYTTLTSDNNDLFCAGAGPGTYQIGITGTVVGGTNRTTLADWQTATGKDASSQNAAPVYSGSPYVLSIDANNASNGTYLNAKAASGTGISLDIDCDTRDGSTPDIGADEFTPPAKVLGTIVYNQASTANVNINTNNNPILRIDIPVTGASGTLLLNSLTVTSLNTSDADIAASGVKLYRTASTTFSTANLLGSAQSFSSGTATFSSLAYDLPTGTTYVWVTYDIAAGATLGNTVDAKLLADAIDVAGTTYPAAEESPTGSRTIADEKMLSSVTVTQASTATAIKGSLNNETLLLNFTVTGSTGTLPLNSIAVTYTGTASADITTSGVKLYRTATAVFATDNLLGSAQSLSGGIATFSSLAYDLPTGNTYVWVTFDVASAATNNNKVDAKIAVNGINVNGSTYNSVEDNPAGNRNIFYNTYTLPFSEVFSGSSFTLPTDWSYTGTTFSQSTGTTYHGKDNTHGIYCNMWSGAASATAITPFMGSITATSQLDFDYRIVDYDGYPASATTLADLGPGTIKAQVSTNGTDFTDIYTINNTNHVVSTSFATKSESLAAYAGQNVYIRFIATWGAVSESDYFVDIDNVSVYTPANMTYSSSTTTQAVTSSVNAAATNQQVIGIQVVTTGNLNPIDLTKIVVNANGTSSVSDISNAKVWYTGTSPSFATSAQFGSTVAAPTTANFDVTGTQTLAQGTNYFWVTYDIASTAVHNNVIDGECTSITIGGAKADYTPTVTAPAGTRAIVNKTLTSISGVQASTALVLQGAANQQVLRLDYVVGGPSGGSLLLNSIAATYTGTSASDIAASGVKLYWTLTTTFATTNLLGTAQSLSGGVATFSGLNYNLPAGTSYVWVAFDIDAAATLNNTVDAKIAANGINVGGTTYNVADIDPVGSRTIKGALSGTYTVGSGGNYASFTKTDGLFAEINSLGLSGNVTINVISNITDETGATVLNQWTETGAGNYTLTIQPSEATERLISSTAAAHLFNLNGADRVTFDGRYSGSGKYLRIRHTNTGYTTLRFTNSAQNNTIKYCYVEGANTSTTSGAIDFLATGNNNNNLIDNCIVRDRSDASGRPANGIYFTGKANASGNTISNSEIFNFTTYGVYLAGATSTTISGNQFYMTSASSIATIGAIYIADAPSTSISGNKIYDLNGSSTAAVKGIYYIGALGVAMSVDIVNNAIILAPTTSGNIDGIDYWGYSANSCNIYFNSVRVGGTHTSGTNATYAFRKRDNVTTMNIKDNVFVNARSNSGSTAKHYAIGFTTTTATSLSIDYNDYFTSGTGGVLGVYSTTDKTTLAAWKASTTQDANSYNSDPNFTSATDLKPTAGNYLAGTSISGITTDYEGTTRNAPPAIGAYEGQLVYTWTGNTSSDWTVAGNWNMNLVPVASVNITVPSAPSNQPQVTTNPDSPAQCKNADIQTSASLTINAGKALTVSGSINNNGALTIKSDATGTGSLIHITAGVPATAERYITGATEAWHLLSSPVESQVISGDFTPAGTYGDGTGYDFYTWYEPASTWVNFKNTTVAPTWNTANGSNNFVVGRGYLVAYQATNPTKTFTGNLSQGAINIPLSYSGTGTYQYSNLVGNPYPSSLDWKAPSGWTRSFVVQSAGGYDMHIWNQTAANYGVYNSASLGDEGNNGATRYIAPMQGFMVKASAAGNLSMTDDVRVHSSQAFLKSTEELADYLKLTVTGSENTYSDQAIIEFNHDSDEGGASKMFSFVAEAPSLYTLKDGSNYSIDFRGNPEGATVIPMNFKAGVDGNYVITASDLDTFGAGVIISIEDMKTGQIQNLMENSVYSFVASKDDESTRFKLHFGGTFEVSELQGIDNIRIYSFENSVYFTTLTPQDATISVFNITGQQVYSQQLMLDGLKQITLNVPTGWYVVQAFTSGSAVSRKVFIR